MRKRHKQLSLIILAFLTTAACIVLVNNSQVIGAMAGIFLTVVGAYTALDLRAVVQNTGRLPPGAYTVATQWKYYIGMLLLVLLFGACMVKERIDGINMDLAYGFLGPGVVAIIGFVIAGMKANKAATLRGPSKTRTPLSDTGSDE